MVRFQGAHSAEHIAEIARLARDIWPEHYTPIIGREQVDYMLENFQSVQAIAEQLQHGYEYYLVLHDGQAKGYLAVVPDEATAALLLSKIYIRKTDRGLGLGKQALGFAEEIGRQRGFHTLWLTVNRHNASSIAWYTRMGFRNAGTILQDIGNGFVMDDYRLEKSLDAISPLPQ